jgi:hypothetical protein
MILIVGVEAGSRQLIGQVTDGTTVSPGETLLLSPMMLVEQRTGPKTVAIGFMPLLNAYHVETIGVTLSSVFVVDSESELVKRYLKEWEAVDLAQRAARAGLVPATSLPGGKNGSGPIIPS